MYQLFNPERIVLTNVYGKFLTQDHINILVFIYSPVSHFVLDVVDWEWLQRV
jgi:hypothetical protein